MAKRNTDWRKNNSITILKAHHGNRAKNLESIADIIEKAMMASQEDGCVILDFKTAHQIKGYCEQLRIIADELKH